MSRRVLLTISYDGSQFNGFQRLKKGKTVQGELERTLAIILKKEILIKGAGRTDKRVHALNQKCHFDLDVDIELEQLRYALNKQIDKYVYVKKIEEVSSDFHARFDVISKTYKFKINYTDRDPLKENYYYQYKYNLDINKMKEASNYLIGEHNFKNFVAGYRKNYVSTINSIDIDCNEEEIIVTINGTSFYQYMVRNIVGGLLMVGKKEKEPSYIIEMLDNYDKEYYCKTLPGNGLYLIDVLYD